MIAARAELKRRIRYPMLSNIELIIDASGLVTNTTNDYGQVDASNVIVSAKSVAPGPTGRDFSVIGSGVTFDPTTKSIAFNGSGRLRSTGAASVYDFLSFASPFSAMGWTAFIVCKIGTTIRPTPVTYALLGNNAGTSNNKGAVIYYANNISTGIDSQMNCLVTKAVGGTYVGRMQSVGAAPSNQFCVVTYRFDPNDDDILRLFINDQAVLFEDFFTMVNTPVTTPTFALEIGGAGNATLTMVGNIKEVILTSDVEDYATMVSMIRLLMNKHGIVRRRTSDLLDTAYITHCTDREEGTGSYTYHLSGVISQNPTNPNQVFSAYTQGSDHIFSVIKKVVGKTSNNKADPWRFSFEAQADIYDPTDPLAVQDLGGGFDQNGVMHLFTDTHTSLGAGGCVGARHLFSSDLTNWTNNDITSVLPSDGLAAWRMYGNLIHVNGVWIKPYYKQTDNDDITDSAVYVLRSTNGTTWTSVTVKGVSTTYINEGSIFHLGGDNLGLLCRNESTLEWSLSLSTDLGLTWDAFTDAAFGETVTSANPPMVKTFTHNGVSVVAAYITNRANNTAFVVYGLPASIISSRGAGWDLGTKIMWWKVNTGTSHLHYGDVVHLDNTLNARAIYAYDDFPSTGGTVNSMRYFVIPTWHVALIESELGI